MKLVYITGASGQDASYLAEFLLDKGYIVHGLIRRHSTVAAHANIDHLRSNPNYHLHYGDITDMGSMITYLNKLYTQYPEPEVTRFEVFHLAAQSHVAVSFEVPIYTANTDAVGTLNVLEALRATPWWNSKKLRVYNAVTSELYGDVGDNIPQNELTPFKPVSPYASAKLYSLNIARNYRDAYNLFICNGILFNHTSPRRGENFILRKICIGVARIYAGLESKLVLGNLDSKRDIGHAADYVKAMWAMLQQDTPDDFVIATGETYTIRELVEKVFKQVNIKIMWHANKGFDANTGKVLVTTDPQFFRPNEVPLLQGDASKARRLLDWKPEYTIDKIITEMIQSDLNNES